MVNTQWYTFYYTLAIQLWIHFATLCTCHVEKCLEKHFQNIQLLYFCSVLQYIDYKIFWKHFIPDIGTLIASGVHACSFKGAKKEYIESTQTFTGLQRVGNKYFSIIYDLLSSIFLPWNLLQLPPVHFEYLHSQLYLISDVQTCFDVSLTYCEQRIVLLPRLVWSNQKVLKVQVVVVERCTCTFIAEIQSNVDQLPGFSTFRVS